MKILTIIFIGIVALFVVFCAVDCTAGRTRYLETSVLSHQYKAAWYELQSHTDSDGNTSFNTIHHPEEYHVFCRDLESGNTIDVQTTATLYHSKTNGQDVTVRVRVGKWTGKAWLPAFAD